MAEPGRRRSSRVRTRIVTAAVVAVGAALTVAAVLLVLVVGRLLERPMRGEARARAAEVAATPLPDGTTGTSPARLGALAAPWPTLAQLVDEQGTVLAASPELAGQAALLATTPADREPHGEVTITYGGREQRFRLDAVVAGSRRSVIVATSLGQVDQVTRTLRNALAVAVPLLVGLVAALAWLLVGRALRPVEALRAEVSGLSGVGAGAATGARRREPIDGDADEIGRLAGTLDGLLADLADQRDTQRRFVADASHELRSPVANIRAALDVARAHPDSRPWPDVLDDVYAQNERVARLIEDLLVLARVEAGQLTRADEQVELAHLAATVVDEAMALPAAGTARPVRLVLERLDEAIVHGDEAQLRRVLVNLVDNARRHARSEVGVSVAVTGRSVRVTVRDDGPGVPAEERAHIFERFVRVDADRSRARGDAGGSGLGLAIVAELVAAHQGTVTVAGGGPGAVFAVKLPLVSGLSGSSQVRSGTLSP